MPLTPEQIARMDAATGLSAPAPAPQDRFAAMDAIANQTLSAPTKKKGFVARVGDDYRKREAMMQESADEYVQGNQSLPETYLQFAGKGGAGFASDIAGEAFTSIGRGISAITPDAIENPIRAAGKDVLNTVANSPVGALANSAVQRYDDFQEKHPRAARNIEATANLGGVVGAFTPIKGTSLVGAAVEKTAEGSKAVNNAAINAVKSQQRIAPDISPDAVRKIGGDMIRQARDAGAVIKPEAAASFIDDISTRINPKGNWETAATVKTEVDDIVNNLASLRGQPMSLDDAMGLESRIGKMAYAPKNYSMGKHSPEGVQLLEIKDALGKMIEEAADTGAVAGDQTAIGRWREGQKYWAASIRARDLDRIIEASEYADHPATAIRVGMRNLIKNKNKFSKYSPEEQFHIKKAASTGVVTDFFRAGSSLLGPLLSGSIGGAVGTVIGGPVGGVVGATASAGPSFAVREGSKAIATARQTARAKKAYESVVAGSIDAPTKKLTMKEIMALPPQEAMFYLNQNKKVPRSK